MASRLDRLFILLETGSNSLTRKTAATQLGSIIKLHPEELPSLLSRLTLCLKSSSWETRVAAGAAVEACLKEWKGHRDLPSCQNSQDVLKPNDINSTNEESKISDIKIENNNWYYEPHEETQNLIQSLLNPMADQLLMGSEGSTYDRLTKLDEAKQKQLLSKQLVGPLPSDVLNMEELISDQDFAENNHEKSVAADSGDQSPVHSSLQRNNSTENHSNFNSSVDGQPQLTARQLNQLKRRAKKPVTHMQSEEQEKKPKLIEITNLIQWVNSLLEDLFCLEWETRHGAATGLREFFRVCGGDLDYVLRIHEPNANSANWIRSTLFTLIKVLAFDRFGDFVSDQVIAPVRETIAQCMGALYFHLSTELVNEVLIILVALTQNEEVWETRHGGLLAIKYMLAMRKDLSSKIIPYSFPYLVKRLRDTYDDVVTVAASGLVPVVQELVSYVDRILIRDLLRILWRSLENLDDLSSACNSIMQLLAGMLILPIPRELSSGDGEINHLQLIYPFLHHKSTSVRFSSLQTLGQLVPNFKLSPADIQLTLRHLYERGFLELNEQILLETIPSAWSKVLHVCRTVDLVVAAGPYLGLWLALAMAHPRAPIEPCHLLGEIPLEDKTFISSSSPDVVKIASTRFTLSKLLSALFFRLADSTVESILISHLSSQSNLQRIVASLIIYYWGEFASQSHSTTDEQQIKLEQKWPPSEQDDIPVKLLENLNNSIYYEEIAASFSKLQNECRDFIATLKHYGVEGNFGETGENDFLAMDQVQYLGGDDLQGLINSQVRKGKLVESLSDRRRGVNSLWQEVMKEYKEVNTMTLSCQSSALTQFPSRLPSTLNPVIKPLVNSIRTETNTLYQSHAAKSLVRLMSHLRGKTPNPNNKIIQNLVSAVVVEDVGGDGIESLDKKLQEENIDVRGVKLTLIEICKVWGSNLKNSKLWDLSVGILGKQDCTGTELATALNLLTLLTPYFSPDLQIIQTLLPVLNGKLQEESSRIRNLTCLTLAKFTKQLPDHVMPFLVTEVLPKMEDVDGQLGAMEAVYCIVEELELNILPWIVLLVVPTLGCMSANNAATRQLASLTFACLIRLLPLESAIPSPPNESLQSQIIQQREFLEKLLNPSRIPTFDLSVKINADLRPYQKQGISWLGFLNKYKLNGILCDDMGLGKTLMTICLLGEEYKTNKKCPSMVICPPTLTGHWVYEIGKFISSKHLSPLHYHGPPGERQKMKYKLDDHNLVVASYDIVRNDLDFFKGIDWHYLILDEGHVIKNGKTKISLAIKSLRSKHRLILSGTPIQNNVLELWSLFDFLMPGFLGTEKQFNAKFGRPILQARDNKSSEKEQEAGALAMEALHRQTLPFLLRRLKEDVLKDLPPKITQDYYCDLSPLQSQLYEDFARTRAHRSLKDNLNHQEKHSHIFQALQYLRKVCNHPKLVLSQGHPQYDLVMGSGNVDLKDIQHAAKLGALKQLLIDCGIGTPDTCSQHRALIFCQLKSMLDIVEEDLLKKHLKSITYLRLDGSVPAGQRHNLVQRFNNDCSIDVLLLTTQVGGLGLNLTGADTVIFVEHDWNPMRDLQAMDRAHRIGQKKVVNVYRLITHGTLEEKIMGLQKFKLMTANTVISCENAGIETMATDQLLDLFTLNSTDNNEKAASAKKEEELIGAYKNVLESVPELWEEKLYDDEYDLSSFIKSLRK